MEHGLASETVVWAQADILDVCRAEASRAFPLETGGTFMGWWAEPHMAVVSAIIGPGPRAEHNRTSFQPDQQWQLAQIAKHYEASGRRESYLGDWHSHPGAQHGGISGVDRGVLRRVIAAPAARCPRPIMAIFWGKPREWSLDVWIGQMEKRLFWERLVVGRCRLQHSV